MFSKVFLGLVLLVALVYGQRTDVLTIDTFETETPVIVITIPSNPTFPITQSVSTTDSTIIGGERDLIVEVLAGTTGRVVSSGVTSGLWQVSTPTNAEAVVTMQYDGVDGSANLDTRGLAGVDLTSGSADAFRFSISSDLDTSYTVTVYGQNGGSSSYTIAVTQSPDVFVDFVTLFSDFTGNVDFSQVGAIEISIDATVDVDTSISFVATSAQQVSTSITPSPSPSPAAVGFTWYTVDDDFGRQPCEGEVERKSYFVSNENIVYYYFYRAYYEPVIYINSAANVAPYLFGAVFAIVLAAF